MVIVTLNENSKAVNTSFALIGIATLLATVNFVLGVVNCVKNSMIQIFIPQMLLILPIAILAYTSIFILKSQKEDITKILKLLEIYCIALPTCMILSRLIRIILFNEMLVPIQILFTIVEIALLFLPMILGLNIARSDGNISFLKTISIIEIIAFAVLSILTISKMLYGTIAFINGFPAIPVLLCYISVFLFAKDIVCDSETTNTFINDEAVEENIAKNVIFTIISLGFYGYFWMYRISKKVKYLHKDNSSSTGEILCLLFVPFYILYWVYTREQLIMNAYKENMKVGNNSVLYLILSLFGLNLISIALMQNDLNILFSDQSVNNSVNKETSTNSSGNKSDIEKLEQLSDLFQKGILTEQEYQDKKKELLNRI